jgi:hypothetical protein
MSIFHPVLNFVNNTGEEGLRALLPTDEVVTHLMEARPIQNIDELTSIQGFGIGCLKLVLKEVDLLSRASMKSVTVKATEAETKSEPLENGKQFTKWLGLNEMEGLQVYKKRGHYLCSYDKEYYYSNKNTCQKALAVIEEEIKKKEGWIAKFRHNHLDVFQG